MNIADIVDNINKKSNSKGAKKVIAKSKRIFDRPWAYSVDNEKILVLVVPSRYAKEQVFLNFSERAVYDRKDPEKTQYPIPGLLAMDEPVLAIKAYIESGGIEKQENIWEESRRKMNGYDRIVMTPELIRAINTGNQLKVDLIIKDQREKAEKAEQEQQEEQRQKAIEIINELLS